MMKKYGYIAFMAVCLLITSISCSDDDDDFDYTEWRTLNEAAFSKIVTDPSYTKYESPGNNGFIYTKVIKEGTGTDSIFYTSEVEVYYTGRFVVENDLVAGPVFDTHEPPYDETATFTVSNVVQGMALALYHMKVGDRWEVCMPYQLGYGVTGSPRYDPNVKTGVPPYSTLKFEIEVVSIPRQ